MLLWHILRGPSRSCFSLRWDYLTPSWWNMTEMAGDRLKAFDWIRKHGSTLGQVVPVFPPYDLPVWTSLATGLYPKSTGVVGDYMFNLDSRELFSLEDPEASLENWWQEGEPIWSLAAKHGRKVTNKYVIILIKIKKFVGQCPQLA